MGTSADVNVDDDQCLEGVDRVRALTRPLSTLTTDVSKILKREIQVNSMGIKKYTHKKTVTL